MKGVRRPFYSSVVSDGRRDSRGRKEEVYTESTIVSPRCCCNVAKRRYSDNRQSDEKGGIPLGTECVCVLLRVRSIFLPMGTKTLCARSLSLVWEGGEGQRSCYAGFRNSGGGVDIKTSVPFL